MASPLFSCPVRCPGRSGWGRRAARRAEAPADSRGPGLVLPAPDVTLSSGCSLVIPPSAARFPAFTSASSAQGPAPPPRPGSRVIQQGDDPAPALPPIGKTRSLTLRAGNSGAHALQSCFAGSIIFSTVRKTRVFSCRLRAPRALQMAPPAGWGWPRAQRQRPLEESRCLLTTCLSLKA